MKLLFASSYNFFPAYTTDNLIITGSALIEEAVETNLLADVDAIRIPTTLLWGKYDELVPMQLGMDAFDSLATPLADKSFVLFENSGHSPFLNEPDAFARALVDFVDRY